jgi:enoyl-CoA hydratase/carnithine racemase
MKSEEDAMQFETIRVTCDGPLGRLTLTRPDRLNAMGATILQELAEAAHCDRTAKPLHAVFDSLNGFARVSSHG